MDFNLRKTFKARRRPPTLTFWGITATGSRWPRRRVGHYQSPAHDWAVPARPQELTVAADLNGGRIASRSRPPTTDSSRSRRQPGCVQDGVNSQALKDAPGWAVRVRFELHRSPEAAPPPVIDGFRITAHAEQPCKPLLVRKAGSPVPCPSYRL